MRLTLATLICITMPAQADSVHSWGFLSGYVSTITLQPTTAPGAVAEVVFLNRKVHADENVTFTLDLGDLAVVVDASVGRGMAPDKMRVTVPDGFIAIPESIDVAEDQGGVILVVPFLGY